MPTFGTMRPGVSFKNAVAQNVRAAEPSNLSLQGKQPAAKLPGSEANVSQGPSTVTFGTLNSSLPPRVQSAPPNIEEQMNKDNKSSQPSQKALLEVTPEGSTTHFVPSKETPSITETTTADPSAQNEANNKKFQEAHQYAPSASAPYYMNQHAYYGNSMNYYPYNSQMGYYPRPYGTYYSQAPVYGYYSMPAQHGKYVPYQSQNMMVRPLAPSESSSISTSTPSPSSAEQAGEEQQKAVAAPPPQKRVVKKLVIINPETGQEVDISAIPKINKPSEAKVDSPSTTPTKDTEEPAEKSISSSASKPSEPFQPIPRKPVVLVDPASNRAIDIAKLAKGEECLEDIIAGLDEDDAFGEDLSSSGSSCDEGEDDLDDLSSEIQFPVILTRSIRVSYPENCIPFKFPEEGAPLRYSSKFLLQFESFCHGVAQDIASVAFPKDLPTERPTQRKSGRGHRHSRQGSSRNYTAEQVTLTNRAADAWKRASETALDEDLVLLREVKQILNKLTEEKFDLLSKQIIDLGVITTTVMTGVIDLLFDKAVEEPRYAPLYAQLCLGIVRHEIDERKKILSDEDKQMASDTQLSIFRKCLVTKCQLAYQAKTAYSKERLARLKEKEEKASAANDDSSEQATAEGAESKPKFSGELTEEDYALIKTKRRVLGNMRFIGELFLAKLIPVNIMHRVIQELLGEVANPEEEEVESVCRLITTIGAALDTQESASLWKKYMEHVHILANNTKLSTRVRFMLLDLIELRENGWGKNRPGSSRVGNQSPVPAASGPSSRRDSQHRGERRDRDQRRDSDQSQDARDNQGRNPPGSTRYSTSSTRNQDVRFERAGAPKIQIHSRPRAEETPTRPLSTASRSSQDSINRYQALDEESQTQEQVVPASTPESFRTPETTPHASLDTKLRSKLIGTFEEAISLKNTEDVIAVVEEIPSSALQRGVALKELVLFTMDKGRKHVNLMVNDVLPKIFARKDILTSADVEVGLKEAFELLDDLVVDIPSALEFAGNVAAVFIDAELLTLSILIETVLAAVLKRDSLAAAKVALYTIHYMKAPIEAKREIVAAAKPSLNKCIQDQENQPTLDTLINKLEIQHAFSV